jgi:HAD superfamily hydrolase (TIGR01509 family)
VKRALPSLVIFDCDGVLIDSEIPAGRVLTAGLAEIGLAFTVEQCHARYRGRSWPDCLADIEAALGQPVPRGWLDALRLRIRAAIDDGLTAMPHARDVVAGLSQSGTAICVASSSNLLYLERVLGATALLPFFGAHVFSASMVARGKPAPDLFRHAAAQMGHAPQDCIVVEDSVPGVRAAVAAGMRVLGYIGDSYCDAELLAREGADIIRDLRNVTAQLGVVAA